MTTGKVTTYDLTVGVKLDIEDTIWLVSPIDVPLLGGQGADGRTVLSSDTCFEKKVEWLDETLLTPRSTLGNNATTTGTAYITVASGDQLKFQTGDVLLVESEYMRVTDYGTTTDTLVVTRGFNSSTAVNHATTTSAVVGVGSALPEGSDPPNARSLDRNNRYNYTEIFGPYKVHVTGTENVVAKYGLQGTEFDHQAANRTKEGWVALEQAILYGTRLEDGTNKWRTMGGMKYFISTNVDSTTTQITESTLLTQMQASYDVGGAVDRIVMGSTQKKAISAFGNGATYPIVNVGLHDTTRGTVVNTYDTDFGTVSIILDRWVRKEDLFGFNREQAEVCTLRPMTMEMLAKTGDAQNGQILMEKTFKFRKESHAFRFSALT